MSGSPMSTKALVEGALLTAFTVVLSFIAIYVPLVGAFASLFVAVPIIVLVSRQGLRTGIMASVVSALLVAILAGPYQALIVVFMAGLVGISIGGALQEGLSPTKTLIIGTVAATIAEVALLLASIYILKIDLNVMDGKAMTQALDSALTIYRKTGMSASQIDSMKSMFDQAIKIVKLTIPGALVMGSLGSTLLNYFMVRAVMIRVGHRIEPIPPFRSWTFPGYLVLGLVAGGVLVLAGRVQGIGAVITIGANLIYFFGLLELIQGVAVAAALGERYNRTTVVWVAVALWLVQPAVFVTMGLWLGVLDPFVDFRKTRRPRASIEEQE